MAQVARHGTNFGEASLVEATSIQFFIHQHVRVPSKWRVHPHRDISCMDTAYVRESPTP